MPEAFRPHLVLNFVTRVIPTEVGQFFLALSSYERRPAQWRDRGDLAASPRSMARTQPRPPGNANLPIGVLGHERTRNACHPEQSEGSAVGLLLSPQEVGASSSLVTPRALNRLQFTRRRRAPEELVAVGGLSFSSPSRLRAWRVFTVGTVAAPRAGIMLTKPTLVSFRASRILGPKDTRVCRTVLSGRPRYRR